jgi:hypothetical protein
MTPSFRRFSVLSLALAIVAGCAPSMPSSGTPIEDASMQQDTSAPSGPFVCQEHAYSCATRDALDQCEQSRTFAGCTRLTLDTCTRPSFRVQGTCPSRAQVCRTENGTVGYCTHSCTRDSDCPLPEGGLGRCQSVGMGVSTCLRP